VWSSPWPSLTPSHTPFSITNWQRAASTIGPNGKTSTISISPSQSSVNTCSSNGQACGRRRGLVRPVQLEHTNAYCGHFGEPVTVCTPNLRIAFQVKLPIMTTTLMTTTLMTTTHHDNHPHDNHLLPLSHQVQDQHLLEYILVERLHLI